MRTSHSGHFILALCFALGLSISGAAQHQASKAQPLEDRIRRIENRLLVAAADDAQTFTPATLTERLQHYQVPGVSIAVINNYQIEWARGYGVTEKDSTTPVTPDTLFQAGSISKPVTAAAALALVQQGKLKLDEAVNARLRSWQIPANEFTQQQAVTLRHLLTHRGGLTVDGFIGYPQGREIPPLVQVLDGSAPANSKPIRVDYLPGSRYRYSGGGFTVLQQMLMDVTGQAFPALMEELILKKAGMKQSTFAQPLPEAWHSAAAHGVFQTGGKVGGGWFVYPEMAAAGLWTTASDLARFAIALQNAARGKGERMLKRATVAQMLTPQGKDEDGDGWGLGIILNGSGRALRFSHSGGTVGFRCVMVAYPATGQGAVVMTNSLNGAGLYREVLRAIAHEYGWPEYLPTRRVAELTPLRNQREAGTSLLIADSNLAKKKYDRLRKPDSPISKKHGQQPDESTPCRAESLTGSDRTSDRRRDLPWRPTAFCLTALTPEPRKENDEPETQTIHSFRAGLVRCLPGLHNCGANQATGRSGNRRDDVSETIRRAR